MSFSLIAVMAGPVQDIAVESASSWLYVSWEKHERNFLFDSDLSYKISVLGQWDQNMLVRTSTFDAKYSKMFFLKHSKLQIVLM